MMNGKNVMFSDDKFHLDGYKSWWLLILSDKQNYSRKHSRMLEEALWNGVQYHPKGQWISKSWTVDTTQIGTFKCLIMPASWKKGVVFAQPHGKRESDLPSRMEEGSRICHTDTSSMEYFGAIWGLRSYPGRLEVPNSIL